MSDPIPQRLALRLLLAAIASNERAGGLLEVRYRLHDRSGMGQAFHAADRAGALIDTIESLGRKTDCYVGAAPRRRRNGGASAIERVWTLWADCDGPEAVEALRAFTPAPSIVVRTSENGAHAWWPLHGQHPLTSEQARRANRRLAYALGADMRATDPARILRVPGSLNFKHDPPAPVECIRLELDVHTPRELVGDLPDPPAPARRSPPKPATRELDATDALRAIAPAAYVAALTGRDVGRDGKARCPFHGGGDERTPSLHVYAEHWYCYGCQRGGTIIDLGALLYGIEPRGRGFHDIRRRLAQDLLQGAA